MDIIKKEFQLTPWERFWKTVHFEKTDHVPVALFGTPRFFASLAGIKLFDCLYDPCKLVEVERMAFQRFPEAVFIPGCWPDYGLGIYSAFGCKIYWSEDSMPFITEPIIKVDSDIKFLKLPDSKHDGFMPWYLKTLQAFVKKKEFQGNLHFIWSEGHGEMAAALWGMQELLTGIYLKPELVKELFKKLTDVIINWLKAQLEVMGKADGIVFCDDISGLVSPESYEEFFLPYHRQIKDAFKDYIIVFHCDTKSDHILELLAKTGIDVFNLGPTTDLANAKKKIGKKVVLMGNIDPVNVMQKANVAAVRKASEKCLKGAAPGGGYILSAGGGMNETTPPENIDIMIEEARKWSYE